MGNVGDLGKIGVVGSAEVVCIVDGAAAEDSVTGLTGHRVSDDVGSVEKGGALLMIAVHTHNVLVEVVVPTVEDARLDRNGIADDCSQSSKYGDAATVGQDFRLGREIGCSVGREIWHRDESEGVEFVVAPRWDAQLTENGTEVSARVASEDRVLHIDAHKRGILAHCHYGCSIAAVAPSRCSSAYCNASAAEEVLIEHTLPFAGRSNKAR